jgi:hypothetical protein
MRMLLLCMITFLAGCSPATFEATATHPPSTQTTLPSTSTLLPTATLPPSPTAAPSPTPIPELSPGKYKMNLTPQEAMRFSPLDLSGEWLVTLQPGNKNTGTVLVSINGSTTQFSSGTYMLNIDTQQLTIVLEICGKSNVGLYHWTFDGATLVLKTIADQCADRLFLMEVHPWARQP